MQLHAGVGAAAVGGPGVTCVIGHHSSGRRSHTAHPGVCPAAGPARGSRSGPARASSRTGARQRRPHSHPERGHRGQRRGRRSYPVGLVPLADREHRRQRRNHNAGNRDHYTSYGHNTSPPAQCQLRSGRRGASAGAPVPGRSHLLRPLQHAAPGAGSTQKVPLVEEYRLYVLILGRARNLRLHSFSGRHNGLLSPP